MAVNNWIMYEPIPVLSITISRIDKYMSIQWINHLPSQFMRNLDIGLSLNDISSRSTSGDNRVNEHHGLMCMHTLLAREHNRIESVLHRLNRHWRGDRLFEESRRILAAEWQHMIYNEWLPIILGNRIMKRDNLKLVKKGYWNGRNECL